MDNALVPFSGNPARGRLLQIFSRYKQYGGEEGSIYRIGDALVGKYDVGTFLASSNDVFTEGPLSKAMGVVNAISNRSIVRQLRHYQAVGHYDCWVIHNVYPAMSPSVYSLAFRLGIPVIQYLHNYRMGCVNGFFLNHGAPCQRCMHGNFWPAFQTACWHGSHVQSGIMGAIVTRARKMDLFEKISHWVAISEAQRQEHIAMGIPADRISVVHHFLESPSPDYSYPDCGDVLFVGRLSEEKGVDRLLSAWENIQDCGRRLWIVGDGPDKLRLEKIAASLSLRNVHFTGFLKHREMTDIWKKTACSVISSIWKEPFGMVVLEAWAKKCPIVAHRIGALPELVDHGENGFLVSPESPQEMAQALLELVHHPDRGRAMGENGFAKLHRDFTKEVWMPKISGVIDQVLSTPRSRVQRAVTS